MNMALQTNVKAISVPSLVSAPVKNGLLQRKCPGCSSHNIDGEREDDQKKRLNLQRRSTNEPVPDMVPPIVHDVLRSPGEPLPQEIRAYMEPRFGHDFSKVRVHTDETAAESARTVNALAYTAGHDIIFGTGQYAPETKEGQRLLAHELTHVVQQARVTGYLQSTDRLSNSADPAEREAEGAAQALMHGTEIPDIITAGGGIQRTDCTSPSLNSRRSEGYRYGTTMAEAANNVQMHNDLPVPDDWDFIPDYRRRFITQSRDPRGMWRLTPPPVEISDPAVITCFVEGVNSGLDDFAESERFWGVVAEGLQLLSMALSTAGAMRIGAPAPGVPRPRLTLIRGGGGARAAPAAPPVTGTPVRIPSGGGGGPRGATALAVEPAPVSPPTVPAPRPRPQLVHSQPEPEVVPRAGTQPSPLPWFPPLVSPVPQPLPDVDFDEDERRGCMGRAIAQRGGNTCHDQFATSISGVTREWGVQTPEGLYVTFDALGRDRVLYEIKTGYRFLLNTSPQTYQLRERTIHNFIDQSQNQLTVANRCGYPLIWYFNDRRVAEFVNGFIQPPVMWRPFDCDEDR